MAPVAPVAAPTSSGGDDDGDDDGKDGDWGDDGDDYAAEAAGVEDPAEAQEDAEVRKNALFTGAQRLQVSQEHTKHFLVPSAA